MSDLPPVPRPTRLPGPEDFPASGPHALATVAQRGGARALDYLVLLLPLFGLILATQASTLLDPNANADNVDVPAWIFGVWLGLTVLYETVLLSWKGQTLGKLIFGIRVARYADGRRPVPSQAALRALLPACFSAVCAVVGLVEFAWVFFLSAMLNPLLRGWHDLAGGTVVTRTR